MSRSINVKIINRGKEGETLCFKVIDAEGCIYEIGDCYLKETFGVFEGYFGSCNGVPAQLNIFTNGSVELLLNQ